MHTQVTWVGTGNFVVSLVALIVSVVTLYYLIQYVRAIKGRRALRPATVLRGPAAWS
jgi:hypothetical protein